MTKLLKTLALALAVILGVATLASCSKKFDVELTDTTLTFNGEKQALVVTGDLPEGAKVKYKNNVQVNAGSYDVQATISCDGYETISLTAKLTIEKLDITKDLKLESKSFEYDGEFHSLSLSGVVPTGLIVSYTNNFLKEVGTTTVKAEFKDTTGNYILPKTLTATLTITEKAK